MEYKKLKIEEIKPNKWNPNLMGKRMLGHLVKEIKRVGLVQPILVNKNKMIIDGEHRWKAAKEAGLAEIPVIMVDMTDKEAKITTVNMNQIRGDLEPIRFAELLKDLQKDYKLPELSALFNISVPEIKNYDLLIDLPDLESDIVKKKTNNPEVTCPNCKFTFKIVK